MNIIGKTRLWLAIAVLLTIISIGSLGVNAFIHGKILNYGIDFTGGTLINLRFTQPITIAQVRGVLDEYKLGNAVIQRSGEKDIYLRSEPMEGDLRQKIIAELGDKFGGVELLEADTIGPVIGAELRAQAIWAVVIALFGILMYLSYRFEFIYAAAGTVALLHDAIIATGFMALFFRNVDISFIAGILTILGYSINDTVVIFDRIRENEKKPGAQKKNFADLVNTSINETMARSINTVMTVVIMVLMLLFFGGETLRDFCLVLLVGFISGAYSSIFIASPLVVWWHSRSK